jgi:hypothetical protein
MTISREARTMRHTGPRFRQKLRITAIKRRRKAVEFMAGLFSGSLYFFRKRNPADAMRDK